MTRFFWRIDEAARFILKIEKSVRVNDNRGCIFIPKMHSVKMQHIAKAFTEKVEIAGMRCPEKLHEDLISTHESISCYYQGDYYVIYPTQHDWAKSIATEGKKVNPDFSLSSSHSDQPV
jgi:FlaA1/EpsC-like NDP-sugar epimerase